MLSSVVLCLRVRPRAHPRVGHVKRASLGLAPDFITNILQGLNGLSGTNTLTYCEHFKVTEEKSFIRLTPVANVIKLFTAVSYDFS
jgi:hypothetical protein